MIKYRTRALLAAGVLSLSLLAGGAHAEPSQASTHASWMTGKGLLEGEAAGQLALDRRITAAEAVTLLARLQQEKLPAVPLGEHWASAALSWAVSQSLLTAEEAKSPDAALTAEQLNRLFGQAGYPIALPVSDTVTRAGLFDAIGQSMTVHVTIAHMNDTHGHITENASGGEFGYARIASILKQWRSENPNFQLFDAGDTFQGTVFVNLFQGESLPPLLKELGINVMEAGNHEFDFGAEQAVKLRSMLPYPMLGANVVKEDGEPLLDLTYRFEAGGQRFVVFGLVTPETAILTHPDNVKGIAFKDPIETAKAMVAELQGKGEHIILLSHCGIEEDREIAKQVPGIELIIGGHSHTKLTEPEVVNGTYIVQDWEYFKSLGRVDMYYLNGELVALTDMLKAYDAEVPEDPEMATRVKQISDSIDEALHVTIGHTDVLLEGDRTIVRQRESNLGNFVADAMLNRTKSIQGYEADAAITNGGGIRTEIRPGDITKKALYDMLPFPNTVVVLEARGSELKAALENGVSQAESGAGRFPQVSGLTVAWNPSNPAGSRIVEVKVGGQLLDMNKTYRIATNDFVAAGGDGYDMFKDKKAYNTGITLYELMEETISRQQTIAPKVEGRITEVK
ncbi:Trifunctional nucleotide phosphoesterase protein YfkN [Paenibacillus solanacearum]|uniref:Trifunctional nucleotide phosphoesterase protein YfkN n=1 Tax=Paenibacillus solanacearum TaxID=2048548 RepID=A0A916JYJ9_9BACL|nr:5'-nucleotidase C-terminal domain-containing protein [Paenibacillus solanacearum]CAG7607931.1 Trifunctional nucleotide phosphoesterase protein YfkN [Paenibacillus solanacearum]